MKSTLLVLCCIATLAFAFDAGHFIPKAYYKLDAEGHKVGVHPVDSDVVHYLRRLRRDSVSSSSSSSSVSSNGGPTYFTSQQSVSHTPDVSVGGRFGGTTGHTSQTTGYVDNRGQVHYQTETRPYGGRPSRFGSSGHGGHAGQGQFGSSQFGSGQFGSSQIGHTGTNQFGAAQTSSATGQNPAQSGQYDDGQYNPDNYRRY